MGVRKIYVEEGEMVEIRVVAKGEDRNKAGLEERLYPERHKYLLRIGSDWLDLVTPQPFCFKIAGKVLGL